MNKAQVKRIAEAYAGAKHEPDHPAYAAFIRETNVQYRYLVDRERWLFFPRATQPYQTSEDMFRDCRNRYMHYFTGGDIAISGHPLFERTQLGHTPNDKFRCVHDVNGHFAGLHPFETWEGELAAYNRHKLMYSAEALPALFGETVGQLCFYYQYGKFVDVQKCAILDVEEML